MGANAQTSVPLYAAAEVLTAADMNISAGTGVPVFATTVTRDAAFGGAGEKVLAEGQLAYIEASNVVQYYDGAAWATVGPAAGGLVLIKSQTITPGASSVAVTDVFSATYEQYQITVSNVQTSAVDAWLALQLGSTTTGYYGAAATAAYATGNYVGATNFSNTSNFQYVFAISNPASNLSGGSVILSNPFATKRTTMNGFVTRLTTAGYAGTVGGYQDSDTSFTGFTLIPSTGTITLGNISVYGLARA
jgi:hypothetical protein